MNSDNIYFKKKLSNILVVEFNTRTGTKKDLST